VRPRRGARRPATHHAHHAPAAAAAPEMSQIYSNLLVVFYTFCCTCHSYRTAVADKPADNPCVTWVPGSCSVSGINPDNFIPAIYSAWMWRPSGTCGSAKFGGSCQRCSGQPHDFSCGYLFPCFSVSAGVWGHKDVCASEGPCIAHLPGTSNISSQTCASFYPGKGPQWEHWGWQVTQKGQHPSKALGQLISHVTGGVEYVLARSPAATPFANCGPGDVGWVPLQPDGTLGCLNAAANCVPWQMCNGFEVAYCRVCKPCPPVFNASFHPGPNCTKCPSPFPPRWHTVHSFWPCHRSRPSGECTAIVSSHEATEDSLASHAW
jgi:hypothetical protein